MDITLTIAEQATLDNLKEGQETTEDTLHRLLVPFVQRNAEASLQKIADIYRQLDPEIQATALRAVMAWKAQQDAAQGA